MKTYAYSLVTFGSRQISIGRQGENLATRIDVDVAPWKTEYPTGTVSLFVVPPVENGYLAAVEENGNTIRWTIRDTDTAYDGHGKAELILKDASGTVIKSVTANTICAKSPSAEEPADPPEAIRPWVEQILEAIKSGDVSAEAIASAVEAYIKEHGVQVEETDPTVPDWAKQPSKPTYTAGEVGARPNTWMPSASDVGADAAGTASGAVAAHNTSGSSHADLRALIDAVTTGKVSVSDIVDNLTTNASGKVLSAAQGVRLKALIDAIVIPDKLPNPQPLTINGQSYDGSAAVSVTVTGEGGGANINDTTPSSTTTYSSQKIESELNALNEANATQNTEIAKKANDADLAAVAKSGSYDDLTNKPTIPTVPSTLPNPNALTFTGAVTGSYDGSAPMSVEIPSGGGGSSGGSGKAKSQILIDQEITELTASLSVTLEHDFHNLTAIIKCSSAGAALTVDSGGAADASTICLLINTTSFGYNSQKVAQTDTSTEMWKNVMFGAEWSDDLSVFKRGVTAEIANSKKQTYSFAFGGATAMYGTLGTDDNAPRTGKTANIVVNGAYINVGTRVVLWGEYYE